MPEPMPCPHCNGAPKLLGPDEFGGDDIYHYVCWNEDCPTNWDSGERASTKERSLEQWNDQRGVKAAVDDVAETACTEMAKVKDAALQAVADAIQAVRDAVRSVYARHSQYPSAREHRDGACCGCFACEAFAAIEALGEPVEPTVRVDAKVLGRSIQPTTGKPPSAKGRTMSEYPGEVHGEKEHYDEGYKDAIQAVRDAVQGLVSRSHVFGHKCLFQEDVITAIEALGEPVEPTVRVDAKVLGRSIQSTTGKPPCWKCKGEERVDVGIAWCSNTHATCSECAGKASHAGGRT